MECYRRVRQGALSRSVSKGDTGALSHQGRWCYGKTPMQTFLDSLPVAKEKMIRSMEASAQHLLPEASKHTAA